MSIADNIRAKRDAAKQAEKKVAKKTAKAISKLDTEINGLRSDRADLLEKENRELRAWVNSMVPEMERLSHYKAFEGRRACRGHHSRRQDCKKSRVGSIQ